MTDYTNNPATDISNSDVVKMCSEILEWHKTGTLPENSTLKKFANEAHLEMRDAEEEIIDEAHMRFKDVVVLLMMERPYKYLRI